jgi:hypothetical protein
MAVSEESCLVFIGAPPTAMGVPMYRDLPNNQAFVSTKYLKNMVDENRVAILHFPYSDAATVPTLVPPHVRAMPHNLPKDMNKFLCQLLEVKKRQLSTYIPMALVEPQVQPSDFSRYHGGKDILDNVELLTTKVELHLAEVARAAATGSVSGTTGAGNGSTLSRAEETSSAFSDSEEKGLLRGCINSAKLNRKLVLKKLAVFIFRLEQFLSILCPFLPLFHCGYRSLCRSGRKRSLTAAQVKERALAAGLKSESKLNIELEPNILSLRGDAVEHRDKTVNAEFEADYVGNAAASQPQA